MSYEVKDFNKHLVTTPFISDIIRRMKDYLSAGFPVHFSGPAGTGKSTLALIAAKSLGNPIIVTYGNDDYTHTDLVGSVVGFKKQMIRDNYVHSVMKSTDVFTMSWVDGAITKACKDGCTLVYDEFTRSRPEANNVLLSVLEEKVLHLPNVAKGDKEIQVHPDFHVIFTSNPEEYAGVHKSQDALRDRMITLDLREFDEETEKSIVRAKAEIPDAQAARIVKVVRTFRGMNLNSFRPTVRAGIMIGVISKNQGFLAKADDKKFQETCMDVLLSTVMPQKYSAQVFEEAGKQIAGLIQDYCW